MQGLGTLNQTSTAVDFVRTTEDARYYYGQSTPALAPNSLGALKPDTPHSHANHGSRWSLSRRPSIQPALAARILELQAIARSDAWRDDEGADLPTRTWRYAAVVCEVLGSILGALPFLSVCEDGYIHITWSNEDGDQVDLEIGTDDWWLSYIGLVRPGDHVQETPVGNVQAVQRFLLKWLG